MGAEMFSYDDWKKQRKQTLDNVPGDKLVRRTSGQFFALTLHSVIMDPLKNVLSRWRKETESGAAHDMKSTKYLTWVDKFMRTNWLPNGTEWDSPWGLDVRNKFTKMCADLTHSKAYSNEMLDKECAKWSHLVPAKTSREHMRMLMMLREKMNGTLAQVDGLPYVQLIEKLETKANGEPMCHADWVHLRGMQVNSYPSTCEKYGGGYAEFNENLFTYRMGTPAKRAFHKYNNGRFVDGSGNYVAEGSGAPVKNYFGFVDQMEKGGVLPDYEKDFFTAFSGQGGDRFGSRQFAQSHREFIKQILKNRDNPDFDLKGALEEFYCGTVDPVAKKVTYTWQARGQESDKNYSKILAGEDERFVTASQVFRRYLAMDNAKWAKQTKEQGLSRTAFKALADSSNSIVDEEIESARKAGDLAEVKALEEYKKDLWSYIATISNPEARSSAYGETLRHPMTQTYDIKANLIIFGQPPMENVDSWEATLHTLARFDLTNDTDNLLKRLSINSGIDVEKHMASKGYSKEDCKQMAKELATHMTKEDDWDMYRKAQSNAVINHLFRRGGPRRNR